MRCHGDGQSTLPPTSRTGTDPSGGSSGPLTSASLYAIVLPQISGEAFTQLRRLPRRQLHSETCTHKGGPGKLVPCQPSFRARWRGQHRMKSLKVCASNLILQRDSGLSSQMLGGRNSSCTRMMSSPALFTKISQLLTSLQSPLGTTKLCMSGRGCALQFRKKLPVTAPPSSSRSLFSSYRMTSFYNTQRWGRVERSGKGICQILPTLFLLI
mmetsp:Transcript_45888/g.90404  ORF Transcript_45888/g.90404 Transcript_45888/m.90404 type:complete len:212 (+) Transcript_45888:289-924(+)